MDSTLPLLFDITVALAIAAACGMLASAIRLSPIVGYIAAGIVVGPFTPGFVADPEQVATLADLGVVLLMFALGIAFSVKDLAKVRGPAIGGSLLQVLFTIAGGWLCAAVSGHATAEGVAFGVIIAASSSMVILKTLLDRGEIAAAHGRLLLSMSIVQDLIVVVVIVLLPQIAGAGAQTGALAILTGVGWSLAKAAAFITASLYVGLRVMPRVMGHVARQQSSELFIMVTAVLALGMSALAGMLGLSAALGAFLAGLMLSESEYDHRLTAEVVPFRDLFATVFFVSVGAMIDVGYVLAHLPSVLAFAIAAMLLKSGATFLALLPFDLRARTAAFTSLAMIPVGELNYLVATTALAAGVVSAELHKLILAASLLTIVLTPAAFSLAPRLGVLLGRWKRFAEQPLVEGHARHRALESFAVVVGYGRVGHTVAQGLRARGMDVVIVDSRLVLVREAVAHGLQAVYGDGGAAAVLEGAEVARARLVVVSLPDFAAARSAVRIARQMAPRATIVARADHARNAADLRDAGADNVLVPEVAGAEAILQAALDGIAAPQ